MIKTKICRGLKLTNNICIKFKNKEQPIDNFCNNKAAKDGKAGTCRACSKVWNDHKNPWRFDPNHKYNISVVNRRERADITVEQRYRSEMKKEINNKNLISKPGNLLGISNSEFQKIIGKRKNDQALDHKVPVARLRKLFKHDNIKLDRAMRLINSYPNLVYMDKKANNLKSDRLLDKFIPLYGLIIYCAQNDKDVNYLIAKYNKLGLNKI